MDFEEGNGINALVLELVEGETLSARIERGPIPAASGIADRAQIADALDASHQKGIVHRDLKPANIKITPAGEVKVLDFGLAKAAGGDSAPNLSQLPTITVGGTHDGVILGTPAYMSPDQARGQPVDKQTDVWAFGCVLYEMLTGRPAFSRSTVTDTLAAILEREPDWTALPGTTSDAIRRVLRRCLEKDVRLRLHDIADARIEIDDELRGSHTDRPRRSDRRLKTLSAVLAVVVLAVATAWAVSRLRTSETSGPVLRLQINPPPGAYFGRAGSQLQSLHCLLMAILEAWPVGMSVTLPGDVERLQLVVVRGEVEARVPANCRELTGVAVSDSSTPRLFTSPRFASRAPVNPVDGATATDCSMSFVVLL